jgi:hypothetical protein
MSDKADPEITWTAMENRRMDSRADVPMLGMINDYWNLRLGVAEKKILRVNGQRRCWYRLRWMVLGNVQVDGHDGRCYLLLLADRGKEYTC